MRIVLLLFVCLGFSVGLKILVINPAHARSHVLFVGALADALADAGHTVHTILLEIENFGTNGTLRSEKRSACNLRLRVVYVPSLRPASVLHQSLRGDPFDEKLEMLNFQVLAAIRQSLLNTAEDTLAQYDRLLKPLESPDGYDIGVSEGLGILPYFLYRRLGVRKHALASACPLSSLMAEALGVPAPPSFVPNPLANIVSLAAPRFSLLERAQNLLSYAAAPPIYRYICGAQKAYLDTLDPGLPDVLEAQGASEFVAVNIPQIVDHVRSTTRHVVHIGGITLPDRPSSVLKQKLAEIYDSADKGVVLVSFGSLAEAERVEENRLRTMLAAFSAFPQYAFVWKFPPDSGAYRRLFANHTNVHAVAWLPQYNLLSHPKTRAFVSHCGANSVIEATTAGVPIVALPLFADQHYNAAAVVQKGTATLIRKDNLTRDAIIDALHAALYDEKYARRARALAAALAAQRAVRPPAARFVDAVEFAVAHGETVGRHHEVSFIVYYNIDVVIVLLGIILTTVTLPILLIILIVRKRSPKRKTE